MPVMTSPAPDSSTPTAVTRANGLTVNWTGGSAATVIEIDGFAATDNTYSAGLSFQCTAPSQPGTFTIPPAITMMFPASNFGGLDFKPSLIPQSIPGTGLNVSQVTLQYDYFTPLTFR